jgi:hypothetical protein
MKILDPGHRFALHVLDQRPGIITEVEATFVKRADVPGSDPHQPHQPPRRPKYPGNVGTHPGTLLQEYWRAEIARLQYLDHQEPSRFNDWCIDNLRNNIYYLEIRAARRHGVHFMLQPERVLGIEDYPICPQCGHIHNHFHPETGVGVSAGVSVSP